MSVKVNIGCGYRNPEGWIGVDIRKFDGVDIICDVGKDKFPFDDNSVDEIVASELFEHFNVDQLFHCLDECWRTLKPSGTLQVIVPKAGTGAWYAHPDHKMHFIEDSFAFYQVPLNGIDMHGYLTHFWYVSVKKEGEDFISAVFSPNKENNPNFPYVPVRMATRKDVK